MAYYDPRLKKWGDTAPVSPTKITGFIKISLDLKKITRFIVWQCLSVRHRMARFWG